MIVTGLLATALSIKAQNPDLGLHGRWGVGVGVGGGGRCGNGSLDADRNQVRKIKQ